MQYLTKVVIDHHSRTRKIILAISERSVALIRIIAMGMCTDFNADWIKNDEHTLSPPSLHTYFPHPEIYS